MTHSPNTITDDLVERARTDTTAFGQLFDHFYPKIFAFCMRRLVLRAVAEDVTSEVFLKVVAALSGFAGQGVEEFRRWIFRITANEINAHLRQSIRRRELLEAAVHLGHIDASLANETLGVSEQVAWEDVYLEIGKLPPRDQTIVSLRFFAGLSHDEIARIVEAKPGAVRVALNRALHKLRERLRKLCNQAHAPGTNRGNLNE